MSKRVLIAEITAPHGINGLVKLNFYGEDLSLFNHPLYISEDGDKQLDVQIQNPIKNKFLAKIEGITDRNSSETLIKTKLYIDRQNLPELNEDEIYHIDLEGKAIDDKEGNEIGKVLSVQNYGASDLIEIKPKGQSSYFVPYTEDIVLEITDEKIIIDVPELI